MSDPAPPNPPARPARWLDRLSVLLLVAGAGVVIGAATPEILRATGLEPVVLAEPRMARSIAPSTPPAARRGAVSSFDDHPQFAPDDDSPRLTERERMYPDGMWPGRRPTEAQDTPSPAIRPRVGHALSGITLREQSDPAARVTGQVPAGARLLVVSASGQWEKVVYGSPDGVLVGWTQRGAVTLGDTGARPPTTLGETPKPP